MVKKHHILLAVAVLVVGMVVVHQMCEPCQARWSKLKGMVKGE